jgi:hypothetical protein
MNRNELADKFELAFKDPDKVKAEEYQKTIEENAAKASESTERLTLRLLSLVMLIVLVILGEVDKLNVGLAEVSNKLIILITLLTLISYTHYDLIFTIAKFDQLSVIHKVIIKHRHALIHKQGLSKYFMFPPTLYDYVFFSSDGVAHQIQSFLGFIEFLGIIIIIPFGAEIIAFYQLSALLNSGTFLVFKEILFIMLLITIVLNLQSIILLTTLFRFKRKAPNTIDD